MKLSQSTPFFQALIKAPSNTRNRILKTLPQFVVDDICEILFNVIGGKIKLDKKKLNILNKHKNALLKLKNTKSKIGRRKLIYNQKGGFIGALLPVIASIIGGIVSSSRQ